MQSTTPSVVEAETAKPLVMIVITMADIGGAQIHVRQIMAGLGTSYRFLLVTGADDFLTRAARALGVEVVICDKLVRPLRPFEDLQALLAIRRLIVKFQPDLVHAHSFKAGIVARLAAMSTGKPSLFTAHGWAFTPGAASLQRLIGIMVESVLCRISRGVVVISHHDQQLAQRFYVGSDKRRYLVPNAADPVTVRSQVGAEPVKLLSIGRLTPVKHQLRMVRVMSQVPADTTLAIIGEGIERPRLEAEIQKLQLADRVFLPGEVTEIEPWLESAGIYLLSSDYEGLPISILEAMAAGLPVVSTDVGGISEAVIHGETGYLVARDDMNGYTRYLNRLIENASERHRMGVAGRQHYQAEYHLQRFLSQMQTVYQRMTAS